MNQEEIRIIREKQLVETIVGFIDDNEEFTVKFPPNYDNCCKLTVGPNVFTISLDEFREVAKKISRQ